MPDQIILTEFRADTSQFTASIDAAEESVVGLDKSEKDAQKSTQGLSQQLGSAAGKATAHKLAMAEVAKATAAAGTNAESLGKKLAAADFNAVTMDSKALAAVLVSLGDQGSAAFDEMKLGAGETIGLLRELIAEASKTPQGAAALATELNEAQKAAIATLQTMGALSAEEAEVVAQAVKLGAAQGQVDDATKKTTQEYVSLRTQVQNAKKELDRMIDASDGKITPELIAAAKKAGELQDRFEDVNATVEAFNPDKKFAAFSGVITNLAGGFTAVQGAMALVGGENESVAKGLLKVQGALAVSQGLQSLFGGLRDNLKNLKLVLASSATGATTFSGALGGARTAMASLNATIAANPIGAVLIAVVALAAAMYALSGSMDDVKLNGEGVVETLERIAELRLQASQESSDKAAQARELSHAQSMLEIERQRAAIQGSDATQEQKALRLQVLADRQASLERQKSAQDLASAASKADQEIVDSQVRRSVIEAQLRNAYERAGLKFINLQKASGQALEDAAQAGVTLSQDQLTAVGARRKLLEKLSEEDRETFVKMEEARQEFIDQERAALSKSDATWTARRVSAINDEIALTTGAGKQAELRAKVREAEAAKAKKIADDRALAERQVAEVIKEIDAQLASSSATESERRALAVRASFEKQMEAAKKAFAELGTLATDDTDRTAIAEHQSQKLLEIETAMNAELARLREEETTAVRDFGKTELELQQAEINKKFDLQAEETKRIIESEQERTEILKQIELNRQSALTAIRTDADEQRLAQQQATQDAEIAAIGAFAQASTSLLAGMAQGQEDAARNFSKAALAIAFDAINAMVPIWVAQATASSLVQPDSVATFGSSGLARAAVLTALIKGVLAGLRSTLGFAKGGEVTKGSGPAVKRSNGDNVLATLQDKEIVLSRTSRARAERIFGKGVWGDIGVPGFGGSIDWTAALARVGASESARNGGSVVVPQPRDDRRIIGALGGVGSLREQRRQTELLEELVRTRGRNPRAR